MKKIYPLFFIVFLITISMNAQIHSLTKAANEPVSGDVERSKGFDSTSTLPRNTGAGQVWNFTSLASNTTNVITSTYTTPASVAGGTAYPTATLAKTDGTNSEFYLSGASQFEMLGMKQASMSLTFTNTAVMAVWPINSGYNNSDVIAGNISITFTTFPLSGNFSGNSNVNASGSGTIQLPGGITFTNCLQVKSTQTLNASFLMGLLTATLNTTNYQYYDASQKFPVLTMNTFAVKTATASYNYTVTAVSINNDIFTGINEHSLSNPFSFYPNPVSDFLTIELMNNEPVGIEIINPIGQIVLSEKFTEARGTIAVGALSPGIYFVKTISGNKSSVKKLIKN